MKIGVLSNAAYCIPLLHTLSGNQLQASVFSDACINSQAEYEAITAFCRQAHISVQTGSTDMLYFWLEELKPDIVFVIGYRHLIDVKQLPDNLKEDIYNVHFGPLPAYRGPSPVFWQIRDGEENLTATIHRINEKFDSGRVVWSKDIKRESYMSFGVVNMILPQVIVEGALYIIQQALQHKPVTALPQVSKASHYYKRPQLQDVLIRWDSMSATQVVNLVQACNPWNQGAVAPFKSRQVKIVDAEISDNKDILNSTHSPGTIIKIDYSIQVICNNQTVVHINMLNIDGTFVPARHVTAFGFTEGYILGEE